ncbi:MAG: Uncharacterised protein [Cyanobium sp. ARS6]|nr:MAG: Uncharacterised protein [Cyanobium sp. ARS6]
MQFIRTPPEPDFLLQLKTDAVCLPWTGLEGGLQLLQEAGNTSLLMPHRVTHDFRGMGCEDQSDVELLKQSLQLCWRNVQAPKAFKQFTERGWFCLGCQRWSEGIDLLGQFLRANDAFEVAVLLDALLENIHQLEIQGEGPGGCDGL